MIGLSSPRVWDVGALRQSSRIWALAGVCLLATGCHHKVQAVLPIAPPTTVPLAKAPEPARPPLVAQIPLESAPVPMVRVPEKKKKPRKKPAVVASAVTPAAPVQVASAGPTPDSRAVIGALTAGDGAPEKLQRTNEIIADLERRIGTLTPEMADRQKEGIVRVRHFEKEARTALDSGDADGAVTLATKAKLLLDDLIK